MPYIKTVAPGTHIFIDSNIFVLAAFNTDALGQTCLELLERIKRGEVLGFTATCVVSEVVHRFMVKEAQDHLGLTSRETVAYLQTHPEFVRTLKRHLGVASNIRKLKVDILPLTVKDLHASKVARSDYGLLANDSLIVGVMRGNKVRHLATHDAGFLRVPQLQVWMPGGA